MVYLLAIVWLCGYVVLTIDAYKHCRSPRKEVNRCT